VLLAVPEIVFQVVALGLEGIVMLIFHLPTGTTGLDKLWQVFLGQDVIGGKRIFVRHLAVRTAHDQFTPVHQQRILASSQGYLIEIAVGIGFLDFPSPPWRGQRWRQEPTTVSNNPCSFNGSGSLRCHDNTDIPRA